MTRVSHDRDESSSGDRELLMARKSDDDPSPPPTRRAPKVETDEQHGGNGGDIPSDTLRRYPYMILLVLGYAVIALFGWVVMCTLSYRPIGFPSYKMDYHRQDHDPFRVAPDDVSHIFARSERYLRSARVLQAIASVLTIPLASAVCSCAAVAWVQREPKKGAKGPTLRQSMVLADKGWTDPTIVAKMFGGGWRQYSSAFLLMALALNMLGAAISPVQNLVESYRTLKAPSGNATSISIREMAQVINYYENRTRTEGGYPDDDLISALASASNTDPQFRLWSRQSSCNRSSGDESDPDCINAGQATFSGVRRLSDPFWSQPPAGLNTGLFQQFAPRVNFTSKLENLDDGAFPQGCDQIPGALYMHHHNTTERGGYSLDVCMPGNVTKSPWKPQLSRQDFSEELYLQIRMIGLGSAIDASSGDAGVYTMKVTLNTTAGYFELPNYDNGQTPGPLLGDGPVSHCGPRCIRQEFPDPEDLHTGHDGLDPEDRASGPANQTVYIMMNQGPLLSTTLALFGNKSVLDLPNVQGLCSGTLPFVQLLQEPYSPYLQPCDYDFDDTEDEDMVASGQVSTARKFLWLFVANSKHEYPRAEVVEDAFASAAFLAVDKYVGVSRDETLHISMDPGIDVQIPHISLAGVIVVSVMLGLFVGSLLALAVYGAWTPRWTNQLDAFAMMRIGASMPESFPLRLANKRSKLRVLDEVPGSVRDISAGEGEDGRVGVLGLGDGLRLRSGHRYQSYASDDGGNGSSTRRI